MSDYRLPDWLQPYKNEWMTASAMGKIIQLEERTFSTWMTEVKGRLRSISRPTRSRPGCLSSFYQVKHVWAFARAHGYTVKPTGISQPIEQRVAELEQKVDGLRIAAEAKDTDLAGLRAKVKVLEQLAAEARKQLQAVELIRLALQMTDPRAAPGVYFLMSDAGECIYVGQSKNVLHRMAGHSTKAFQSVRMLHVQDQAKRLSIEARMIDLLQPRDNIAGRRMQ